MTLAELVPGVQVRLGAVPLVVARLDGSGAILEAPGRWVVYRVAADGLVWMLEAARAGSGRGRPPGARLTLYTLADVEQVVSG